MPEEREFYDLKTKSKFKTSDYQIVNKTTSRGIKTFAVAQSPSGIHKCWKVIKNPNTKSS